MPSREHEFEFARRKLHVAELHVDAATEADVGRDGQLERRAGDRH